MIAASRLSTAQLGMYPLLAAFLGFIAPLCAAQGAAVIVSGGDQTSGSGQAYVVVGDNVASYSAGQQTQQSLSGASYSGQTGYIRGQQYQVVSADDVYGSSNQGSVYVQSGSASQPATDVQLNEVPVQSLSVDLLPSGYQQQLSSSYSGALGSSSSSAVSDAPAQSVQSSNFAGLNLAAFGIEPASYLAGSGRGSTQSATQSTSKPAATYSAGESPETSGRSHGKSKKARSRKRVQEEQDDEEQEPESEEQDEEQEDVADEDQPETGLDDGGDANLEDANYEVATRVSNSEAKSGYGRRRRRRKVKPKVIIVKKVLPLSTTTYRG